MWTYLHALLSGTADPFWAHLALLSVSILAAIGFATGTILATSHRHQSVHSAAKHLIIAGMAVELVCVVLLFASEEGISAAQRAKIAELDNRLAPRTLTLEQERRIAEKLKAFQGIPFDFATAPAQEPALLEDRIKEALEDAGWQCAPDFLGNVRVAYANLGSVGLRAEVPHSKLAEWGPALHALANAMEAEGLQMVARVSSDDQTPINAIHLIIGTKG
jgi:hypothetical protein